MTKKQFIACLPATIEHPLLGPGELSIVADTYLKKAACYRHLKHGSSYWSFGSSWEEVYSMMNFYLKGKELKQVQ
jgi:hypothetical protein